MYVKLKSTGQYGDIPDDKFDPSLFEQAVDPLVPKMSQESPQVPNIQSQQQVPLMTPKPPEQKGFLKSAADFLVPKLSNVASMSINTYGMGKDLVEYKMAKTGEEKTKQLIEYNQKRQKVVDSQKEFGFSDTGENQFDPAGYAKGTVQGGLEAASLVIPAGTSYKAAAALGSVSGAMRGLSEADSLGEVPGKLTSGALGGAGGGVVGKGATAFVGYLLKKSGANMALRALRPSKSQVGIFKEKTGEDLTDFVIKNKLHEAGTGQVDELIKPLQMGYDELALKSGANIPKSEVERVFNAKIAQIEGVPNSEYQRIAEQLTQERDLFLKSTSDNIPIKMVTEIRRAIDSLIPDSKFMQDPIMAGKNRILRGMYKEIIDTATNGKTKVLGDQLNNMYAFRDIAKIQDGLGKGNLPIGLLGMLGLSGGAGYMSGQSTTDKIKNAGILMGLTMGINNPAVIALLSKTLYGMGQKSMGATAPQIVGRTLGSIGSIGISGEQDIAQADTPNNDGQGNPNIGSNNNQQAPESNSSQVDQSFIHDPSISQVGLGSSPQDIQQEAPPGLGSEPPPLNEYGATISELRQLQSMAIMQGATKDASRIGQLIDIEVDAQKEMAVKTKAEKAPKLSEGDKKFAFAKQEAQKALDQLDTLSDIPVGPLQGSKLAQTFRQYSGNQSQNETMFLSKVAVARTAVKNALLGANQSPQEVESLLEFTFDASLPREILRDRIASFVDSMDSYMQTIAGPDTSMPQYDQTGLGGTPPAL